MIALFHELFIRDVGIYVDDNICGLGFIDQCTCNGMKFHGSNMERTPLGQGKLPRFSGSETLIPGNIYVFATEQIHTLLCCSIQLLTNKMPNNLPWALLISLEKFCNGLILHTLALSAALQPVSFSVVSHHKCNSLSLGLTSMWGLGQLDWVGLEVRIS
jgi:hypothetical protein